MDAEGATVIYINRDSTTLTSTSSKNSHSYESRMANENSNILTPKTRCYFLKSTYHTASPYASCHSQFAIRAYRVQQMQAEAVQTPIFARRERAEAYDVK